MKKTSIIIPCYNEQENIREVVKRFVKISEMYDLELILVNNGSADATKQVIQECKKIYSFIKPVDVKVNQGYGYGILQGLKEASGDYLGWMHADLQSSPMVFYRMIEEAEKVNGDFLFKGKRKNRPVSDTVFTIGMSIFESLYLRQKLWDINAQPVLFNRKFYEGWKDAPYDFSLDLYIYYYAKKNQVFVKRFLSRQYKRLNGRSTWNTGMSARWKLIRRVVSYSRKLKWKED